MNTSKYSVSVVIMTLNAEKYIKNFLNNIMKQSLLPNEVLVVDSESTDNTVNIASSYDFVKIIKVRKNNFDHGGTRDLAFKSSFGDIVLFFSQDAEISNSNYISSMVSNFSDDLVAMVYGRQVARNDSSPYEKLIRNFNYPDKKMVKCEKDISTLGIKCFYMSDVCSGYKRDIYTSLGGFEQRILTNEDMLIATKAILSGFKVVYDSKAVVIHSHDYNFMQELRRNFDIAVFFKMHDEFYSKIKLSKEGFSLVKFVISKLYYSKQYMGILKFIMLCIAKLLGNKLGMMVNILPLKLIVFLSANKNYWKKN